MNQMSSVMHRVSVVCLAFFALVLAGCGASSPESVVEKYFEAVADGRTDEAIAYFSLKDVKENDLTAAKTKMKMIVDGQSADIQQKGGLESVKGNLVEQEGDKARVRVELKFKNGFSSEQNMKLVNDNGWKIALH